MNIVCVSPEFPENYAQFSIALRNQGATVLGLSHTPWELLQPGLRNSLTEYYRVSDLHRYDELIRALGYFTYRHGKIDRLESLNEYWLETDARLRTDFNIPGLKSSDLPPIKQKSVMKQVFQSVGLRVARGHVFDSADGVRKFVSEVGYPVVAKPDIGVGANRTWRIGQPVELEKFLAESPKGYFLEEYVIGDIQTFDGLAGCDGEILFCSSLRYSQGIMEVVNEDADVYYYTARTIPEDLESAGRSVLRAFNVRERFFHFEFFRTPEGDLVPLEVNMRPPGGLTVDMFNYGSDINLFEWWAKLLMGKGLDPSYSRRYHVCFVGRKNGKPYSHGHDAILSRCGKNLVAHRAMEAVFRDAMGDYAYLVRSPDLEEVLSMAQFVQEKRTVSQTTEF